jgi:hypothetical protein
VLIGRVDDSAHDVTLRFADGSTTSLPIDAQSRVVQWSGPVAPAPTEIESGGTRCTLADNVPTTGDEQSCDLLS